MERADRPCREQLAKAIQWLLSLDPGDPRNFRVPPEIQAHEPRPAGAE